MERGPGGKKLIKYLLDHDKTKAVARIDVLQEDQNGLYYEAQIGSHSLGQDFQKMIESGIINQHSFGFSVPKDKSFYDKSRNANIIKEVIMYEGSAIQFLGANPDTSEIGLKSFGDITNYFDSLEKFVKTSDATDETLQALELRLKSLQELLKPSKDTLNDKEADFDTKSIIDQLKKTFKENGRITT